MHSSMFLATAQLADERACVVSAMVEAPNGSTAVILSNDDAGTYTFTRVVLTDEGDGVLFDREIFCGTNRSKALKYLSDFTLDAREVVHLESGALVANTATV